MSGRHQTGYLWKKGHFWYGRWYEDVLVDGHVERKARARKLAPYNERYRNEKDVRPILDDILRPINNGQSSPRGTMTVAKFYEGSFYPYIKAERKPSTAIAYDSIWKPYLSPLLQNQILRDFRCVDATTLLADIYKKAWCRAQNASQLQSASLLDLHLWQTNWCSRWHQSREECSDTEQGTKS